MADHSTELSDGPDASLLEDWPLRPWVLGALLALCGLLIHFIVDDFAGDEPWRAAAAGFLWFGGLGAAFTLTTRNPVAAGVFALIIGLVMAGIAWQVVAAEGHRVGADYAFAAGCFFSLLALPLFQAGFHRPRFATAYRVTHFHVWADAISGGGALAFTGLSWLLLLLLDQLFGLVGIGVIGDLIDEEWFGWTWSAAAFGAGLGVLRNNLKIIGALQNVVMLVFALLAVPFALALVVFLIALIASGGSALWEATDSATPILLACAAGSFVLFNAIIRDCDAERSGSQVMQAAALVLAAVILPLSVFAAISMGVRIDQYGLAPERIWGLIAIAVACAYGVAAWVALGRGRLAGWSMKLRDANLHLAAGVCVLALVLALPLWDFGAMSARNQVARLEAGKVSAEEFDFAALRWDFGEAGREVLAQLADGEGEVAELAIAAQAQELRPSRGGDGPPSTDRLANMTLQIDDPEANRALEQLIRRDRWRCNQRCVALDLGFEPESERHLVLLDGTDVTHWKLGKGEVLEPFYPTIHDGGLSLAANPPPADAAVEVRDVTLRRVYIDGRPVGEPFPHSVQSATRAGDDNENLLITVTTTE